jgi:hypothetical protein
MSRKSRPSALPDDLKPIVEQFCGAANPKRPHPTCCELNSECHTVESMTNVCDDRRFGVRQLRKMTAGKRALHEKLHSGVSQRLGRRPSGIVWRRLQRMEHVHMLAFRSAAPRAKSREWLFAVLHSQCAQPIAPPCRRRARSCRAREELFCRQENQAGQAMDLLPAPRSLAPTRPRLGLAANRLRHPGRRSRRRRGSPRLPRVRLRLLSFRFPPDQQW